MNLGPSGFSMPGGSDGPRNGHFGTLPECQHKVALIYYSLYPYPQAISVLEDLGREHPEYDLVQFFLGNSYMAAGDLDMAEGHYRKAIEIYPGRASNYSPLAQLLRKRGGESTGETRAFPLPNPNHFFLPGVPFCFQAAQNPLWG